MTGQFMGWNDDQSGAVVDFNHPLQSLAFGMRDWGADE